jgi:RNA polymerase sigma-70 factor (ECF subfamily)
MNQIGQNSKFDQTRWSVVLSAQRDDTIAANEAMAILCQTYWYPLYAYVRRKGKSPQEAEDLTQEFFARMIEKRYLDIADQERGKFRSFLLCSFKYFLANEYDKSQALKRGGGMQVVSIDQTEAEDRYTLEPVDSLTPDKLYQRRWAMMMIEQTLESLRSDMEAANKLELFEALKGSLTMSGCQKPYTELSEQLGMSVSAIKVTVHRMRKQYRAQLREYIAQTVQSPDEVDEEIAHLFSVFS